MPPTQHINTQSSQPADLLVKLTVLKAIKDCQQVLQRQSYAGNTLIGMRKPPVKAEAMKNP